MIGYDVDGGAGPFEVVLPPFEGVVDSHKLLVVDVIIGLSVTLTEDQAPYRRPHTYKL